MSEMSWKSAPGGRAELPGAGEVFDELSRTFDELSAGVAALCKSAGLSIFQFNVLNAIRAAGAAGVPSLSLARTMLNRVPDITRLIDRLEGMGLVERARAAADRRVVLVRLSERGRDLIDRLDASLRDLHARQFGHLEPAQLRALAELLRLTRREAP